MSAKSKKGETKKDNKKSTRNETPPTPPLSENENSSDKESEASFGIESHSDKMEEGPPVEKQQAKSRESGVTSTISESEVYPVASEWKTGNTVDLHKIYSKLPKFITEMKVPTSREELECVLNHDGNPLYNSEFKPPKLTSHMSEIISKKKGIGPQLKPSFRKKDESWKASSLQTSRSDCYLDCEYMLNM